jgi:hypothetical protein
LNFTTITFHRARSSALHPIPPSNIRSLYLPPPPPPWQGGPLIPPKHQVPFLLSSTTRRATVEVFKPAFTWGKKHIYQTLMPESESIFYYYYSVMSTIKRSVKPVSNGLNIHLLQILCLLKKTSCYPLKKILPAHMSNRDVFQVKEFIHSWIITLSCKYQSVSSSFTALSIVKYWYDDWTTCKLNTELH